MSKTITRSSIEPRRWAVLIVATTVLSTFAVLNPVFMSVENLSNVVLQASIIGIIAIGMTIVVIGGGIDLSVGSVAALSGIVMALLGAGRASTFVATAVALAVGVLCGSLNGVTVGYFGVPSFIVTLGMAGIARGLALTFSGGRPMSDIGELARALGGGRFYGVPAPVLALLAVTLVFQIALTHTVFGIRLYAVGGSARAAWVAGIGVRQYVAMSHALCGVLAAFAGVVAAGRLSSAQPVIGTYYELDAITASVVGGATLAGGKGNAFGALGGAILLAGVRNAMVLVNLSPYYHDIVIGVILIAVVVADRRASGDAIAAK